MIGFSPETLEITQQAPTERWPTLSYAILTRGRGNYPTQRRTLARPNHTSENLMPRERNGEGGIRKSEDICARAGAFRSRR